MFITIDRRSKVEHLNGMLFMYIIFTKLSLSAEENLLSTILKSTIGSNKKIGSCLTEEKLWIKFLEKELETRSLPLQNKIHRRSLLEYYNRNFRQGMFKRFTGGCEQVNLKRLDTVETTIFGELCGSSKEGRRHMDGMLLNILTDTPLIGNIMYSQG